MEVSTFFVTPVHIMHLNNEGLWDNRCSSTNSKEIVCNCLFVEDTMANLAVTDCED